MSKKYPGRDEAFFFRKEEQQYLLNRLNYPGITVIKGRPRSGKTWLVGQVLRHLDKASPQPLIGFCRCSAQDSDNLMRVIDDLYIRWRERTNLLEQAKEIVKKNFDKWPQLITRVVGSCIDSAQPFGPASSLVAKALKRLPGLEPRSHAPRLKDEQGQQLIQVLVEIAQANRVILSLDQWEQSANLNYELEYLRKFTREVED